MNQSVNEIPNDPFDEFEVEDFKNKRPVIEVEDDKETQIIENLSRSQNFSTTLKIKEKKRVKTFVLWQSEIDIIENSVDLCKKKQDEFVPSQADIVRAGIKMFGELSDKEKVKKALENRGRGR